MRALLLCAATCCLACYTPKGAFIMVEQYVAPNVTDYTITPGDMLQFRISPPPQASAESGNVRVRVRGDGRITLPLVNDWVAGGKSPASLAHELEAKFKPFINNPSVSVSLEEARALTVSVLGEVSRAGNVTLEPGAGVMQAIAAAGGLTDFAHPGGIFVLRNRPGEKPVRVRFLYEQLTRGEGPAASFSLSPGDVVVVE
jgi:polysaccharide biosynthesis/export protein